MILKILHIANINDNTQQACTMHAETYDHDVVLAAAPLDDGVPAGWTIPPTWTTIENGKQISRPNPRINNRNMMIYQLVRDL